MNDPSIESLQAEIDARAQRIAAIRAEQRGSAVEQIKSICATHDIKRAELMELLRTRPKTTRKPRKQAS